MGVETNSPGKELEALLTMKAAQQKRRTKTATKAIIENNDI